MRYEIAQVNRLGNRSANQDRFAVVETEEGVLLILADGMGGRVGGELAAETLVDVAEAEYAAAERPIADPGAWLREIIHKAHDQVIALGRRRGTSIFPGTTGVLCLLQQGRISWAHVGDSRLYVFHEGLAVYRTTDHSYVEELYQKGRISRAEQESHPRRNQITQCIGCQPLRPQVTVNDHATLHGGDIVLLCSDGFWSPLDDAQMGAMLGQGELEESVNYMAEIAERNSYPRSDNISVVALRFISTEGYQPIVYPPRLKAEPEPAELSDPSPRPKRKGTDPHQLQSAIEQIEQVLEEYRDEFEKDG